jgi:DNA-binding response OmpR family regulator
VADDEEIVVLVVDDDPYYRRVVESCLQRLGIRALGAASADEASRIFQVAPARFDILLIDLAPGTDNWKLADRLRADYDGMKVITSSQERSQVVARLNVIIPREFFLPKPFDRDALEAKIVELMTGD